MPLFSRRKKQTEVIEAEGPAADPIPINGDVIRLGQFLKLANLVDNGARAKEVIAAGEVTVNGEVEVRRGRQLGVGDLVQLGGQIATPVDGEEFEDNLPW
jgi:ribosome-associated protein